MRKNLLILLAFIWQSNVMAQIPEGWELVPNEYVVFYENTNAKTNRSADGALSFQYVSLSDNEKNSLVNDPLVALISNVYQQGDARLALTNELMILSSIPIQTLLNETGVVSQVQKTDSICFDDKLTVYVVTLDTKDPLVEYEKIKAHSGCKIVETNYVIQTPKPQTQSIQGRSINYQQWALHNEAYPNYDINIEGAWNITKGEGVKIAVIDEGVDLDHSDLVANLLPGYDMTDGLYGGVNGGYANEDDHGTKCAGIIVAAENNFGIVGVAPQAKVIPIRGAYSDSSGHWVSSQGIWFLRALEKAFAENVDVISNSWSTKSPSFMFDAVLETISQSGRNGNGIIVIHSTGNESKSVINTPSNHPKVLAVGSSTQFGERSISSNYGIDLDVVAPGENVYTTTIQNSYMEESGTSFACPHVAGVVALMLSVNPDLTREEVHKIICQTAYKLPNYTFTNDASHPYGSWNEEVGYGLVDAGAAVFRALSKKISISGPDDVCQSSHYYLENLPDSSRVIWGLPKAIGPFDGPHLDLDDLITPPQISPIVSKPFVMNNALLDTVTIRQGYYWSVIDWTDSIMEPYVGDATLWVYINYQGDTLWRAKNIYIQEKQSPEIAAHFSDFIDLSDEAPEHLLLGLRYHFTSELFPDEEDLEWTIITYGDTITGIGIESPVIQAGHDSVFVKVFNPNTDECINLSAKIYTTMQLIGMDFANPVNDIVDIQVAHKLPTNTMARSVHEKELILYEGEFEVELWDMYRGKLRTVTGKNGYVQMPLHSVAVGNYILRLIIDGQQVDNKPLMVR